ncbi:BMP family ABC transporter substrate-binding protein [Celerinatantimonas sp. YJH-8]|uniref:BMP family ABC transporter substrate-binding protein n=1 Tax=Celerinatantimonas sp. YJH-8 TaxID=3228714 RepID=UPI0038C744EC
MKIKNWIAAAILGAAAMTTQAAQQDPLKVGFVYIGPIGDHGWSYEHEQGRLGLQKHFGDKVKTTYVENVDEGADAARVITQLAKAGNKLIFTTSFGYMNPTLQVAKRFPKVIFEHATGYKQSRNMGSYNIRTYEGRYVSGIAAGLATKTNTIGYVATFPIPEVIRDINAVYLGAKTVNPNIKIKVVWVNTWYDPAKETDAANALMDQGADIMLQHTDSPAPLIAAAKRGFWGIGQASDMYHYAPDHTMFSLRNHWAPFYIKTTQEVMDGTWKPKDVWGGLEDDVLQITSLNKKLPENIQTAVLTAEKKIKSGELHPFVGPLYDNTGKKRVEEGHVMTDEELAGMMWFVKGVDVKIPK